MTTWQGCDIPDHQGCDPWNCRWKTSEPRYWGERPPHPTCIDVTAINQTASRSEWICGPECPKEA